MQLALFCTTQPRLQSGRSGFTLLEMMISVAIFSILMTLIFSFMSSLSDNVSDQMTVGDMYTNANVAVNEITETLFDSTVTAPSVPFTATSKIALKHYYDANGDGIALDLGLSQSGMRSPFQESGVMYYWFIQDKDTGGNLVTLKESKHGNLNGDGDSTDIYAVGTINRVWVGDTSGTRISMMLTNVLQVAGAGTENFSGDIDGDGNPDPIFQMDSSNLITVSVWLYVRNRRGNILFRNIVSKVTPVNM